MDKCVAPQIIGLFPSLFNKLFLIIFFNKVFFCAYYLFMRKQKKLDKRTRMRLRELAKVENTYNLLGVNSAYKGFSIHGGKSKRAYYQAIKNANENQLAYFVDKGISQIKY